MSNSEAQLLQLPVSSAETHFQSQKPFLLPEITKIIPMVSDEANIPESLSPSALFKVAIRDPYIERFDPELVSGVAEYESCLDRIVHNRRLSGEWRRVPDMAYGANADAKRWGDQETLRWIFKDVGSKALELWQRRSIPSANALQAVTGPDVGRPIIDRQGKRIGELDIETSVILSLLSDGKGIRSRGAVMAELVNGYIDADASGHRRYQGEHGELEAMSVACGTALPIMLAADRSHISPRLTLVDIDEKAMNTTRKLGEEVVNFQGQFGEQKVTDIFDREAMEMLRQELEAKNQLPHLMDAMGIFEYVSEEIEGFQHNPVDFLRSCYEILRPGGRFIAGQMRSDRPNPEFTMGAVCWPFIVKRSPAQVMEVIQDAGIPLDQVQMYLPEDGVYSVFTIDKPDYPQEITPGLLPAQYQNHAA